jgi:hypothetical protein
MIRICRRLALGVSLAIAACVALPVSTQTFPGPPASTGNASPQPMAAAFVRGAYGKDSSGTGYGVMAESGFNSVMTGPYRELLGPIAAQGLRGVVWLGNFINAPTCNFEKSDATVTKLVAPIAGDPAVLAYYLGDEPHVSECPKAPLLFKKRSDLVHALDHGSQTFTVIQASENGIAHDYAPWTGSVDIIGFDVYPCARASATCNFGAIDSAIQAIRNAGVKQYWAVLQDFQDCYYRLPTPQEIEAQFDHWAGSGISGYFVFSWNYQSADPKCVGTTLDSHPDNIDELKHENAVSFFRLPAAQSSPEPSVLTSARWLAILALVVIAVGIALGVKRARSRRHAGHDG